VSATVTIRVNGAPLVVPADVSLAAALLNAGHARFRTSPGGAPRGPLCGMGTCFECRLTVDGVQGVRSCLVTVREGMQVTLDG